MARLIGYSLLELATGTEYAWTTSLPWLVTYWAGSVNLDRIGLEIPNSITPTHRLVERWQNQNDPPVGERFVAWTTAVYDEANDRFTVDCIFEPIPPPSQEEQDRIAYQNAVNQAVLISAKKLVLDTNLSVEDRAKLIVIYPPWESGVGVVVGDLRRYEGALYSCIQAHTTQADWTPPTVPALWSEAVAPGTIGAWRQPLGAFDAYPLGALVTHNDQIWCSSRAANVWEPGTTDSGWWVYTV